MRHLRILGLCIAAVFAVAAFTASSALAGGPEWGKCEKVAPGTGKYGANCTEKVKGGEYNWVKGKTLANVPFTGHNVGAGGVLSTTIVVCNDKEGNTIEERVSRKNCTEKGYEIVENGSIGVECSAESDSGEASGKNSIVNVKVVFTGCQVFGSIPCETKEAAEGEVVVNPLKGTLGYINKAEHTVGVQLEPVEKHGSFAKFECGGFLETNVGVGNKKEGVWWEPKGGNDGIISPITPVNLMTSTFSQVYTVNHETQENIPNKFEGKKLALLEDYVETIFGEEHRDSMWNASGEEVTVENTPTEEGEIKG